MESFVVISEIATTAFSSILKCRNKKTKEIVVLKIIREKKSEDSPSKQVLREISALFNLRHENIVKLKNFFVHKINIVIEMEFCSTSLYSMINTISKPFYSSQIKKIIWEIAQGLKMMHDHDIIHRDIKPSNILIDDNSKVKIADFGSCRVLPDEFEGILTPQIGTKWYKPPEILLGAKKYGKSADIWSFGCTIAELFILEPLFPGNTDFEMISYIFEMLGYSESDHEVIKPNFELNFKENTEVFEERFDNASEEAISFLKSILVVNPQKRLNIQEIIEHPYLASEKDYLEAVLPVN